MAGISFDREPDLGTRLTLDAQVYDLVGSEPYRCKDGRMSVLLEWETVCPHPGCGEPFRVKTGLVSSSLNRRCPLHRRALKPVKGRRGRPVVVTVHPA